MSAEQPATPAKRRSRLARDRPRRGGRRRLRRGRPAASASIRSLVRVLLRRRGGRHLGVPLVRYVLAWIFIDEGEAEPAPSDVNRVEAGVARVPVRNWRVAAGVGLLTLSLLLVLREAGIWWSRRARLAADPRRRRGGAALAPVAGDRRRAGDRPASPTRTGGRPGRGHARDAADRSSLRRPLPRRLRRRAGARRGAALPLRQRRPRRGARRRPRRSSSRPWRSA